MFADICAMAGLETPIGVAIDECVRAKRASNRREIYVREMDRLLRKFAKGIEDLPVSIVSPLDIDKWLGASGWGPSSRQTIMLRLSAFFSFAKRRGYCAENPLDRLDRITLERKPPRILSPAEATKYLAATCETARILIVATILGLYAGIRPAEIQKLTWDDICLSRKIVTVNAAASKVRRRRIVPLEEKAVALLAEHEGKRISVPQYSARIPRMRVAMRMNWPAIPYDLHRHCCASYWIAKYQDPARVAMWLGNSVSVLLSRYYELVSREDAAAYWSIKPDLT